MRSRVIDGRCAQGIDFHIVTKHFHWHTVFRSGDERLYFRGIINGVQ